MLRPALVLLVLALGGRPAVAVADSKAEAILERAIANEKQLGELDKALAELDALVAKSPRDAEAHYARGWVLSRQGKDDAAVAAYDRAFALDKTLADAAYNAGVVLARLGRSKDAADHFDKALIANPKHVDAAYNAGQSYYDQKKFAKASDRWRAAAALAPEDFQIAKKLVQVYVALGDDLRAAKARDVVYMLWRSSKDPAVSKLRSYVYDQFDVDAHHVYAYEAFDASGDLAYVYQFTVVDKDKVLGSINLETSAASREQGVPYLLGIDKDGAHSSLGVTWNKLPDYKALKIEATKAIKAKF